MLKALYDYGIRNHLTIPPGFLKRTSVRISACPIAGDFGDRAVRKRGNTNLSDIGSLANSPDKCNPLAEKESVVLGEPGKNRIIFVCF